MNIKHNLAISDSGFVFNPSTGDSFSVNPMGLEILRLLKENKPLQHIKQHLLNTYQTDADTIDKDLNDFVGQIKKLQLTNN